MTEKQMKIEILTPKSSLYCNAAWQCSVERTNDSTGNETDANTLTRVEEGYILSHKRTWEELSKH